jgi:hypothetical protein
MGNARTVSRLTNRYVRLILRVSNLSLSYYDVEGLWKLFQCSLPGKTKCSAQRGSYESPGSLTGLS